MSTKDQHVDLQSNPILVRDKIEVENHLKGCIQDGVSICNTEIKNHNELSEAEKNYYRWVDYIKAYLSSVFNSNAISNEFERNRWIDLEIKTSISDEVFSFRKTIENDINKIRSIISRLNIYQHATVRENKTLISNKVFLVHGADEAIKNKVARVLERLQVDFTILHEQPSNGFTIIEKFEIHAEAAGFAVVLLTPDDCGYKKDNPDETKSRARQNVILELGYFLGLLTRKKVVALYVDDIEFPSDYQGVIYIKMSDNNWELELAREMKNAGLPIDVNKLL